MLHWQDIVSKYFGAFTGAALRYLVFAGVLYLIFYVWKKSELLRFKIQQKFPKDKDVWREIGYSFLSLAIFAGVGVFMFMLRKHGYTKRYTDFNAHSVPYFIFSIIAFIIIHDTYFYWTHRFMHWKVIYPYVHRIHHQSTNPTPWAAFAFHPLEALVEVGVLLVVAFILPIHHYAILAWVFYMTGMNVLGHLGFELFPDGFASGKISKWHNTSTHHNQHHKMVNCNYGLYFNFWDRIMRTNHEQYETTFDLVRERSKETGQNQPAEAIESLAG